MDPFNETPKRRPSLKKIQAVLYRKNLRQITGSVNAAILMNQLEFWFKKMKNKPIYKFKEPCNHPFFSDGDSWTEELGFSSEEFDRAFDKIGKRFRSKKEFNMSNGVSKEKLYYSIYFRPFHLTYYFRNHEKVKSALIQTYGKPELPSS